MFRRNKNDVGKPGKSHGGDILQLNAHIVDLAANVEKAVPIWGEYLPEDKWPIGIWMGITELMPEDPPMLVEVSCIALIPDE